MASDPEVEIRGNEVLLIKDGHPVLKVERGTPLSLVKLLYEADPRNSGCVIGLRPCTDDPLPCFVTLDETALSHAKYDVIVHAYGSTKAKNETPTKQDLGLPKPQLQETAVNTDRSGVSPQLVSEGSGQVDTSSSQDLTLSDLREEHDFHSTAPAEHSVSVFNHPRIDAAAEKSHKQSHFQEHYLSSSMTVPQRKRSLGVVQASSSPSQRRKHARKVFPRKITMMVPNTSQAVSSGVQVQSYSFYPFMQSSAAQSNPRTEGERSTLNGTAESIDSSGGMCDSTAGGHENLRPLHENGHFTEDEGEPNSHAADAFRPSLNNAFSTAEDGRVHSWESSSTNDSSPAVSEEQPAVVDINSENSGTELEQEGEGVLCESSPVPYQFERTRTNSFRETNGSMSSAISRREASNFGREPSETAVVTLENTVQVKTEPAEKCPPAVQVIANDVGTNEEGPIDQQNQIPRNSRRTSEQSDRFSGRISSGSSSAVEGRTENREDNNICNVCNKQFETIASLCRHKRTHSGERPFICNICGWGFNLSGNLNQHMAIHQKVKPFRCQFCGKTFARSNVLKAHVRCHTGERPFQCHVCGSNFVISHNLKKHLLIRHGIQGKLDKGDSVGGQSQPDGQTP